MIAAVSHDSSSAFTVLSAQKSKGHTSEMLCFGSRKTGGPQAKGNASGALPTFRRAHQRGKVERTAAQLAAQLQTYYFAGIVCVHGQLISPPAECVDKQSFESPFWSDSAETLRRLCTYSQPPCPATARFAPGSASRAAVHCVAFYPPSRC